MHAHTKIISNLDFFLTMAFWPISPPTHHRFGPFFTPSSPEYSSGHIRIFVSVKNVKWKAYYRILHAFVVVGFCLTMAFWPMSPPTHHRFGPFFTPSSPEYSSGHMRIFVSVKKGKWKACYRILHAFVVVVALLSFYASI